jgi:hypothetical protein
MLAMTSLTGKAKTKQTIDRLASASRMFRFDADGRLDALINNKSKKMRMMPDQRITSRADFATT